MPVQVAPDLLSPENPVSSDTPTMESEKEKVRKLMIYFLCTTNAMLWIRNYPGYVFD
jgi:hypothetical protein